GVIDLLALSNRLLDKLYLSRDQSSPQRNGQVLARDQPFRRILESGSQIRLHAGCQAISRTLIMAPVHSNLLRLSLLDEISQLGRRSLATIADYLIVEFLLSDRLRLQASNDGRSMTIPLDDCCGPPCQIAEPKILGQRV